MSTSFFLIHLSFGAGFFLKSSRPMLTWSEMKEKEWQKRQMVSFTQWVLTDSPHPSASVEWKITRAFCNSSFSGNVSNWFWHRKKLLSFHLFLFLLYFFYLSLFLLLISKRKFFFLHFHSFHHFEENTMACKKT